MPETLRTNLPRDGKAWVHRLSVSVLPGNFGTVTLSVYAVGSRHSQSHRVKIAELDAILTNIASQYCKEMVQRGPEIWYGLAL